METEQKTVPVKRVKTGGRKPGVKNKKTLGMRAKAQPYADKAITVVYKLLKSENETIRLSAAKELIDRGYGRPQQSIEKTVDKTVQIEVSDTDVARRAAFLLHKAGLEQEKPETQH